MAFELFINEIDYSAYWVRESLTLTEALQSEGHTLQFVIQTNDPALKPLGGHLVQWYKDGALDFAGRIGTVDEMQPTSIYRLQWQCSCVDFTVDFDRHLVTRKFESQLAGDLIRSLVGIVGLGFTSNNVVDGAIVAEHESDLELPSQIISSVAEAIEHQWYIGEDRDVHFFYIQDLAAPVDTVDFDEDVQTYNDVQFQENWTQVKNVIYLKGGKTKSTNSYDQTFNMDGDSRFESLAYEPWSIDNTTITLDGIPQEILLDSVDGQAGDGQGVAGQVYLCLDNWGIRFPDGATPTAGQQMAVDYDYGYEPTIRVEDPASIALMEERENTAAAPSDGVHELLFNVPDFRAESEDAIWEYGQLLLLRYAPIRITATFSSILQGWDAGQSFRGYSLERSLDEIFYISSVTKTIRQTNGIYTYAYAITASTSPFPG